MAYGFRDNYEKAEVPDTSELNNYLPLANLRAGTLASTQIPPASYVDTEITFSQAMPSTPTVVCSVNSLSTSTDLGSVTASAINATKDGFTIRIFNNSTNQRAPGVSWIAYA